MNEQIILDPNRVEAKVYVHFVNKKGFDVYLVKISFKSAGIHINSITVQPNPRDTSRLWVQSPRYRVGASWVWPVQIEKKSALWPLIERLALESVARFKNDGELLLVDEDTSNPFPKSEPEFM